MSKQFQEIVLYEIRENRKAINKLEIQVTSNKIKLGLFVSGITILLNILFIFISGKAKSFFL